MSDRIIGRKMNELTTAFYKVSESIKSENYTDALDYLNNINEATRDIRQEIALKRETEKVTSRSLD